MEKRTQELVGKVVSAKNDKTITVLVETYRKDRLYGKRVKYSKKLTDNCWLSVYAKEQQTQEPIVVEVDLCMMN